MCSKAKVACSIGCLCLDESEKCGSVVNLEDDSEQDEHYWHVSPDTFHHHDLCLSTLYPLGYHIQVDDYIFSDTELMSA